MIHSYSSIATFKQCPAKWNWSYKDKFPIERPPPSPAMERGSKIHESIDHYMLKKNEFLHPEIHKNYGQFMFSLREKHEDIRPEFEWGITWEFEPCNFSSPDAMLRGLFDLLIVPDLKENLLLYEWKTGGKYTDDHRDQVVTYAVPAMIHFPESPGVDAMITYLDKLDYDRIYYPRTMLDHYKSTLKRKIDKIESATEFPPMPSFKCGWCPFSRHNGGPCAF